VNRSKQIEQAFRDFNVNVKVVDVKVGPLVSMYEVELDRGIRSKRVISLAPDIARCIGVQGVRITTSIGRNSLSMEVPNEARKNIDLLDLLQDKAFSKSDAALPIILGQDLTGETVVADLASMPHLLVAGTTGSGKSVGVNGMIISLLSRLSADQCKFLFIDPKMLELSVYNGIPHLLRPTVTDSRVAVDALEDVVEEMERRYHLMGELNVRNIANYNERVAEKLPYIVVVIDEFADLMQTAGKTLEGLVQRIAQKARAAGIHLIMATQRPSVDVVTGVLKANLPTRISYKVASNFDSRTILGEQGAEDLLGKGDMLFMQGSNLRRVHGAFIADDEVMNIVENLGQVEHKAPLDDEDDFEEVDFDDEDEDPTLSAARSVLARSKVKPTVVWLAEEMNIRYLEAARLLDQLDMLPG
jgi:DNA segregation ATPase FtsK/SpoIIIE, S-DNA-T family